MSAVFLHRHLHGRRRPDPVLRRGLCSLQLLGFPRLLGTAPHLSQPGLLDLLVPGKLGGPGGRVAPQMTVVAALFAASKTRATGAKRHI